MKDSRYSRTNSLVNLSSSILKFFNITPFHPSIKEIDDILTNSGKKKVTILLFDGMNKYIKSCALSENDSMVRKAKIEITSVFPPTTVAATNALLSGRYPVETGWLGWSQHFNDLNVTVDMFTNMISKSAGRAYPRKISYEYCPYQNIMQMINEKGDGKAYHIANDKIIEGGAKNLNHFFELLDGKMMGNSKQFIYGYWTDPDSTIHQYGVHSKQVRNVCKTINKGVTKLAKKHPDNIILVIADHGLINVDLVHIDEHRDLYDLLAYDPYLDSRANMIKVKEGKKEEFRTLFEKYYSPDDFLLMDIEQVKEEKWFGDGEPMKYFDNFLGDFLIVSRNEKTFTWKDEEGNYSPFVGAHSGMTEEEMIITVAIYNK